MSNSIDNQPILPGSTYVPSGGAGVDDAGLTMVDSNKSVAGAIAAGFSTQDSMSIIGKNNNQLGAAFDINVVSGSEPQIAIPNSQLANSQEAVKAAASNPWFKPSFLASFLVVMMEVAKSQKQGHYLEAQLGIQGNKLTLALAQNQADLTIASYALQAQEKQVEAIASFMNAAVSAATIVANHRNIGAGKREAQADTRAARAKADEADVAAYGVKDPSKPGGRDVSGVSTDPDKIKDLQDKATASKKHADKMEASEDQRAFDHTTRLNQTTQNQMQMVTQMINGTSSLIQASIKIQEGQIEAQKQMNDAYMQLMRTYTDNAFKNADEFQQNLSNTLDFIMKIVDSDFRAHSLGQA